MQEQPGFSHGMTPGRVYGHDGQRVEGTGTRATKLGLAGGRAFVERTIQDRIAHSGEILAPAVSALLTWAARAQALWCTARRLCTVSKTDTDSPISNPEMTATVSTAAEHVIRAAGIDCRESAVHRVLQRLGFDRGSKKGGDANATPFPAALPGAEAHCGGASPIC